MGRPDNGMGKPGEKSKGFGLSAEAIAKLRQVQDLRQEHTRFQFAQSEFI